MLLTWVRVGTGFMPVERAMFSPFATMPPAAFTMFNAFAFDSADPVRTHAAIEALVGQVVDAGALPIVLGGDHSIAEPDIKALRCAIRQSEHVLRTPAADWQTRAVALLAEIVPNWTMAPVVAAFQAMRGVAFSTATTLVAEAGDLRRFDHPRKLMAFLGLVPSERCSVRCRCCTTR